MIPLQVFTGSVNFTTYLHVTLARVSSPTQVVWELWIPEPKANYNFIIPAPDEDVYYVTFYQAPTNAEMGLLVSQCTVAAVSAAFKHDILFYEFGNLPATASVDDTNTILTDTYLIGKEVESLFKEGFRFLELTKEATYEITTGVITLLNGTVFAIHEKFTVGIKYSADNSGNTSTTTGGLYAGSKTISTQAATLLVSDKNKRIRLQGSAATQVITIPSIVSLSDDDGFYFDNTCGGVAVQPKIIFTGSDSIKYNGFFTSTDFFQEFWVSKGEHLLIRKYTDGSTPFFEVITDYKGVEVGRRMAAGVVGQPGYIPEDFNLYDGDEYGRVWWYIKNKLPATHVLVDDNCINPGYAPSVLTRPGQFIRHSSLKKFRVPNTQNLSERGLANFNTYGADAINRPYDYPGGFMDQMILSHAHPEMVFKANNNGGLKPVGYSDTEGPLTDSGYTTGLTGGGEQRVKNFGVIYSIHI